MIADNVAQHHVWLDGSLQVLAACPALVILSDSMLDNLNISCIPLLLHVC